MKDDFVKVGYSETPVISLKEGEEVIGIFEGSEDINVKGEERKVHYINVNGEKNMMWGCGLLDYLLSKVEVGKVVKIVYLGKEKTKIGKMVRMVNKYEVYVKK